MWVGHIQSVEGFWSQTLRFPEEEGILSQDRNRNPILQTLDSGLQHQLSRLRVQPAGLS